MTSAPRCAITWQIAAPIPPEAPVTSTLTRVASPSFVISTSLPPRLDLRDFRSRQLQAATHESIELRIVRHPAYARSYATARARCSGSKRAAVPRLDLLASAPGTDAGVLCPPWYECDAGPRQCHEAQSQPQGATARRVFRPCDALLPGRLRDAPSADTAEPAGQHRVLLLRVRTHGLCQGRIAAETARQRRGLHSPHQPRRAMTRSRRSRGNQEGSARIWRPLPEAGRR